MSRSVSIIVPVYGDWPSLKDCIASLKEHVNPIHKVMLVNDCGPDADDIESNIIREIKDSTLFEYHRNPENLGFLKNCNRAVMELDRTNNDVILLNSDTIVTRGFVDELVSVLDESHDIATVSPRSNNATIATIPIREIGNKELDPQKSYRIFLSIKDRLPQYNIAPVSHGFCILIRRSVIDEHGLFDEIFNKGYGEEVDFCLRIAKFGHRSAICNRAFVYHMEARSFSMETKKKLIGENERIVDKRYPSYRREARAFRLRAEEQESRLLDDKVERAKRQVIKAMRTAAARLPVIRSLVSKIKSISKTIKR